LCRSCRHYDLARIVDPPDLWPLGHSATREREWGGRLFTRGSGQEYGAALGAHAVADGAGAVLDDFAAPCAGKPEANGCPAFQGTPVGRREALAWMEGLVVAHCRKKRG